ncbi:MAG: CvpA family protein [Clostridia bacterium]|nr:CvpA family protein [Clostridia bacterium]
MHWFIDFVLIAVLALYTFKHFRLGLMHTVYNIGKFIASMLAAMFFGKQLGYALADGFFEQRITDSVYGKLNEFTGGGADMSEFFANLPDGFTEFVRLFGVNVDTLREKYGTAEASEEILRDMAETIANPIVDMISAIVAYVAVFLIVYIVLSIVVKCLKSIKIPILTGLDKTLGLLLGMVLGLLSASLIATAVYSFLEFLAATNSDSAILDVYNNSYVFKFIYSLRIFEFIRNLI